MADNGNKPAILIWKACIRDAMRRHIPRTFTIAMLLTGLRKVAKFLYVRNKASCKRLSYVVSYPTLPPLSAEVSAWVNTLATATNMSFMRYEGSNDAANLHIYFHLEK